MKKLRVAVLYGGRSGEHEVSLQSAASVINHLDRDRFEIAPVAIDKQGRWHLNDVSLIEGKNLSPFSETRRESCFPRTPPTQAP
jgi:D-alanine-D-alanine ligase-like ATP-grasp enzyme